ncbi:MAG TPA: hypothetical protein VE032_09945 [Actinomycetota bacterium]|nr:hypothetical protein [Actinomycetota bacterium]
MSTPDQRLRERLERITSPVEPDVDRHLDRSLTRGRRLQIVRRAAIATGTLAVVILVAVVGQRVLDGSSDRIPAGTPTPTVSAPMDIDGTWTASVTGPDVEAALAADGLGTWTDQLLDDLGGNLPVELALTIEDGTYAISADGEVVKEGDVEIRGNDLVLSVDPNGVTVLDATVGADGLTFTFVSNSTQPYPPDMVPEEAVQRVLFTSVPFERT